MNLLRTLRASLFFAPVVAVAASCSHPDPGALMLAMTTDLDVPDDVTSVGLRIATPSRVLIDHTAAVQRRDDGSAFVRLPATFAVLSPDNSDDSPSVTATAVAYQNGAAIVLRRAVSTVPHGRIALLRMPLLWVNKRDIKVDAAKAAAQSTGNLKLRYEDSSEVLVSPCPEGQTLVGGECTSDVVPSESLLPCTANDCMDRFFPAGGMSNSQCFDVRKCFIDGTSNGHTAAEYRVPVPVDPSNCSATLPPALQQVDAAVNLAVAVPDHVGKCTDTKNRTDCYVALRPDTVFGAAEGYKRVGSTVQLPKFVCKMGLKLFGTIGCNRVFDETIEACPVTSGEGTNEPMAVPFIATGEPVSKEDAGGDAMSKDASDASARVYGPSDGRLLWTTDSAVPLAIQTDYQTFSNLLVATSGGRLYRGTPFDTCGPTDAGMPATPPFTLDGLGKAPLAYALAIYPNIRATAVGVMASPQDTQGTIANFSGLSSGTGPAVKDSAFPGRAVDVAFTGSAAWISRYDAGGTLELARATTFTGDSFVTQAITNAGTSALTGSIYPVLGDLYTARRDPTGLGFISKVGSASNCGSVAPCTDSVVVRLSDPMRSNATIRSMFRTAQGAFYFTAIRPGRTDIDVYWLDGNGAPQLLAADMDVGDRGLGTPPVSIAADNQCVYVIRNSLRQTDGGAPPTSHELVCIDVAGTLLPRAVTVLAHVGNATAMGTYTPGGTLTRIYWGEVSAQGVGEVRCVEHLVN